MKLWGRPGWQLAMLLILGLALYLRVLEAGFVYDDHRLIEGNPSLRNFRNLPALFTQDLAGGTSWQIYRPLPAVSLLVDHTLWGGRPAGFHLSNVLWHLVAVLALYWLGREIFGLLSGTRDATSSGATRAGHGHAMSIAAALVFAVHPINAEAVAWVCRRPDVMAGAMIFGSLAAFAKWLRTARRRWAAIAVALCGVAFLCKEIAVAVPFLFAVLAFLHRPPDSRGASRRSALLAAGLAFAWIPLYALLRWRLFGTVAGQPAAFVQNWLTALEGGQRALASLALVGHYLRLLVFPRVLSADYSWRTLAPPSSAFDPYVIAGALATLGSVAAVLWALRRHRAIAFGLIVEAGAFLPVSNWIVPIGTSFAERLFYVPSAGVALASAAAITLAFAKLAAGSSRGTRALVVAGLTLAAVSLCVRTYLRTRDWKDDLTLFRSVISFYPNNVIARTYVAIERQNRGDLAGAVAEYRHALAVYPDYDLGRLNLALVYLQMGDAARAAEEAGRVAARDPRSAPASLALARALLALGRAREAEPRLLAVTGDPDTRLDALVALGELYLREGRAEDARQVLREARRLAPDDPAIAALLKRAEPSR